jgi:hypothetical protein
MAAIPGAVKQSWWVRQVVLAYRFDQETQELSLAVLPIFPARTAARKRGDRRGGKWSEIP